MFTIRLMILIYCNTTEILDYAARREARKLIWYIIMEAIKSTNTSFL